MLVVSIGYITRERSLRDLHPEGCRPEGMQITVETNSRVMQPTCIMAKALNMHLARFEDRNSVWPKLMVTRSLSLLIT